MNKIKNVVWLRMVTMVIQCNNLTMKNLLQFKQTLSHKQ